MATETYTALATTTLSASASSVTFSSIDQSYGDLVLVYNGTNSTDGVIKAQANNDTGSNYSFVRMGGNGSIAFSASENTNYFPIQRSSRPTGNQAIVQIMDYSATDKHKTILSRGNIDDNDSGNLVVEAVASRWANTSAITELDIFPNSGTFDSGSTFSLYGVAK